MSADEELKQVNINLRQLIGAITSQSSIIPAREQNKTTVRDDKARAVAAGKIISDKISKGFKGSVSALPKVLQSAIDKSSNSMAKNIAGSVKKVEDVLRVNDQVIAMRNVTAGLNSIGQQKFETQEALNAELADLEKIAGTV